MKRCAGMLLSLLVGCQAHVRGILPEAGYALEAPNGATVRLRVDPAVSPEIEFARGLLLDVTGKRGIGGLRVSGWWVAEGAHGLQAWWGLLQRGDDGRLALLDARSGEPLALQTEATDALTPWIGRPVLLEGYLEDTRAAVVVYYRPLFAAE